MNQTDVSARNRIAWTAASYQAWVSRYGSAAEAAARIVSDPGYPVRRLLGFVGDPRGLSIANPLGSHGRVAVSFALMGADVTVFDLSESNARYARELATEAGVAMDYLVGDLEVTSLGHRGGFDVVVMSMGIVHYFIEIDAFVRSVKRLLTARGKLVLEEFHPLLKKSIGVDTGEPVFERDYFHDGVEDARTPYDVFVDEDVPECVIRRWNLGEIVTAFASGGFRIDRLVEHPSEAFGGLPGTFTLVVTAD